MVTSPVITIGTEIISTIKHTFPLETSEKGFKQKQYDEILCNKQKFLINILYIRSIE